LRQDQEDAEKVGFADRDVDGLVQSFALAIRVFLSTLRRLEDNLHSKIFDSVCLSAYCPDQPQAAARLRHVCDELTTALEELPSLLSCVHGTLTAFKRSRDLQKCSADLYVSLIASMDSMVGYLTKSSAST
jgi:hypothetical protein